MQAKQTRSRETVERILSAATLVFAEGGMKAVTHRAVAERAGVSLSSTTRFFRSKQDLLVRTYEWGVAQARLRYRDLADRLKSRGISGLADYCHRTIGEDLTRYAGHNIAWYHFLIESSRIEALRPASIASLDEMRLFWIDLAGRAGIEDPDAVQTLIDYLIGDYFLILSSPEKRHREIRDAQTRVRDVASAIAGERSE